MSPPDVRRSYDTAMTFPREDSLCEHCGYPLQGLPAAGGCPECGSEIAASDPVHRTGLPWQRQRSVGSWLATAGRVLFTPDRAFRLMRVGGSNRDERLYLVTQAAVAAGLWLTMARLLQLPQGLTGAAAVLVGVVTMTLVEAMGVTYFSRRRGWRVPWSLAERIACYASPGWHPAVLVFALFMRLERAGTFAAWPVLRRMDPTVMLIAYVALLGVSILAFETLVWVGVRQARFANAPAEAVTNPRRPV